MLILLSHEMKSVNAVSESENKREVQYFLFFCPTVLLDVRYVKYVTQ
jgi:hypothetical protein